MTISIAFGTANGGWLPARLVVNQQEFLFSVSYTPNDFILDLVTTLSRALSWEGTCAATVNEEPVQSDWKFYRVQSALVFSIIQYSGCLRGRGKGKKLVECSGGLLEIAVPFWRALCELESRRLREQFETHWRRAFPHSDLGKLTAQIEQLKHEAAHYGSRHDEIRNAEA